MPSSPHDVTLELERLQDLFSPPTFDEFGEAADIPSGIERLVTQIKATRGSDIRVTVVVPEGVAQPELESRLGAAIRSYAAQRLQDVEHRRRALRREGLRSLLLAIPLLMVLTFIDISVHDNFPDAWNTAGDFLAVVFAWVILWYPLDTLFWYGRPLVHERNALRVLETVPVTVVPRRA